MNKREAIERKVITHLYQTAIAAGFGLVTVDDGGAHIKCATKDSLLDAVFSVDLCIIWFRHPVHGKHCASIVLGNDGWDCIADCSIGEGWDDVMEAMSVYVETVEDKGGCDA